MKGIVPAGVHALLSRQTNHSSGGATTIDRNAAPPNLSTLANDTLFNTWRPRAHVLPPSNHIGDPCMHYTDACTGLFHVGFLYSSEQVSGAAGATTSNFVTYRDVNDDPARPVFIVPGGKNDPVAVFDGSVIPVGINGTATLLYTSVSYLPLHWSIPYIKGSETQSLAVSYDGGANFTKVEHGPSIPGAPYGSYALNVTGFRDPYVFQSAQLDDRLGSASGTWYVVISGGVHDIAPSQFLYRQLDPEFRDWEFLGQWWSEATNSTWADGTWAGRWGFNWECGNIFFLDNAGYNAQGSLFTTLGTEWGYAPVPPQTSPFRNMLWASASIRQNTSMEVTPWCSPDPHSSGPLSLEPDMAGFLDWGRWAYAGGGKEVPANSTASRASGAPDRFIIYLWLTSNDFGSSDFPDVQQGWDGALTTPRELRLGTIANVVDNELARETASWRVASCDTNTTLLSLETLEQVIVREAEAAYKANATQRFSEAAQTINAGLVPFQRSPSSKFYLLTTTLTFPNEARGSDSDVRAGLRILSSQYESTTVFYQFANESMIIDRSNSSAAATTTPGILTDPEVGKIRLFDIQDAECDGSHIESLELTILVDNSVVEIYVNQRFAMSTWIWSWYEFSNNISFFVEGSVAVEFSEVEIWEGLVNAWPGRAR